MCSFFLRRVFIHQISIESRPTTFELSPYMSLLSAIYRMRPAFLRRKLVEWTPNATLQRLKDIIDIQDQQVKSFRFNNAEHSNLIRIMFPGAGHLK